MSCTTLNLTILVHTIFNFIKIHSWGLEINVSGICNHIHTSFNFEKQCMCIHSLGVLLHILPHWFLYYMQGCLEYLIHIVPCLYIVHWDTIITKYMYSMYVYWCTRITSLRYFNSPLGNSIALGNSSGVQSY